MYLNQCIFAGNLTRDIDLKHVSAGGKPKVAIASGALALNRRYKNAKGETVEEVTFIDFSAYEKDAETLAKYVKKGSPVVLIGRLKQESWEGKDDGKKRSKHVLVVDRFQFVPTGEKKKSDAQGDASAPAADAVPEGKDDDIPFD